MSPWGLFVIGFFLVLRGDDNLIIGQVTIFVLEREIFSEATASYVPYLHIYLEGGAAEGTIVPYAGVCSGVR